MTPPYASSVMTAMSCGVWRRHQRSAEMALAMTRKRRMASVVAAKNGESEK